MSFDIDRVLKDMIEAISEHAQEDAPEIKASIRQILDNEWESLKELGEARLRNEIDDTVFDRELERERKVVEAELLTIEIMTKALAQKAVNAAIDVFINAVKAAI